ncbi:MAG: ABC transporter substrate-binding protein [Chitinophagales bacterium]
MLNKKIKIFILVFLLIVNNAGCGSVKPVNKENITTISVKDDCGNVVLIKSKPNRIVSLSPSHTEILFALGLDKHIVGVTNYCNYPPEAKKKTKVGNYASPSLEKIISLAPDLVLADSLNHQLGTELGRNGIAFVELNPRSVNDTLRSIETVGRATGQTARASDLVRNIQKDINKAKALANNRPDSHKPAVYFELCDEPLMTVGPGTVIDDLIRQAGGTNMAGNAQQEYPQISPEVIIKNNPDVIITGYNHGDVNYSGEDFIKRPGWTELDAVKNQRVYRVDPDIVMRAGPRIGQALLTISRLINQEN